MARHGRRLVPEPGCAGATAWCATRGRRRWTTSPRSCRRSSGDPPVVPIKHPGHGDRRTDGERSLLLRHDGHRRASLDQDSRISPTGMWRRDGLYLVSPSFNDGEDHSESRHPHLRPDGRQHRGTDPAGRPGVLLIGLSVWRFILWRRRRGLAVAVLESEPGAGTAARIGIGAGAVGGGATSAARRWDLPRETPPGTNNTPGPMIASREPTRRMSRASSTRPTAPSPAKRTARGGRRPSRSVLQVRDP